MGLAKLLDHVKDTMVGTPTYVAPELASGKPYTYTADMCSVGIILWEIWNKQRAHEYNVIKDTSNPGFSEHRPNDGCFVAERHHIRLELSLIKAELKKWARVARACWSSNPKDRPSADKTHAYKEAISAD